MQDLGGVSVTTPWGSGGIKWKRVNYDLGSFNGINSPWADSCPNGCPWMEDLGGINVNTPWGGGSINWKRASEDLHHDDDEYYRQPMMS